MTLTSGCDRAPGKLDVYERFTVGIVGGKEATQTDAISQVTVMIRDSDLYCSGTIISSRYVLTAAHCVSGVHKPDSIQFVDGLKVKALRWFVHPNANQDQAPWYDMAIIELASPVNHSNVATLAEIGDVPKPTEWVQVAGFGYSDLMRKDVGLLRFTSVQVIDAQPLSPEILTKGFGKGSCGGDSGGPAYKLEQSKVIVWGVTSRPSLDGEAQCGDLEFYSNISSAKDWILSIVNGAIDDQL